MTNRAFWFHEACRTGGTEEEPSRGCSFFPRRRILTGEEGAREEEGGSASVGRRKKKVASWRMTPQASRRAQGRFGEPNARTWIYWQAHIKHGERREPRQGIKRTVSNFGTVYCTVCSMFYCYIYCRLNSSISCDVFIAFAFLFLLVFCLMLPLFCLCRLCVLRHLRSYVSSGTLHVARTTRFSVKDVVI